MKRIVKTVEEQTYIIEEFNTFGELIKVNDSRKSNFGDSRTDDDDDWRGCSYEDAVEMLRYGWCDNEKVKLVSDTIKRLEKEQETHRMTFKNDIVGYAPIVPLALRGVPQNMINTDRKPKKAKVINLIVDVSVSCGTSVDRISEWGAKVVAKIMNLEKEGYRVRIEVITTFIADNFREKAHVMKVLIKGENQPFDIKRMMFPIAHSAMLRRFGFDWYERLPEAEYIGGYGKSLIHHSKRHAEEVKKQIADTDRSYYICNQEDIDKILNDLS